MPHTRLTPPAEQAESAFCFTAAAAYTARRCPSLSARPQWCSILGRNVSADLQLCIHSAPAGELIPLLDLMREHGLRGEYERGPVETLTLGQVYRAPDAALGLCEEVAARLEEDAPNAVFELWQDPHWSADGHYHAHAPKFGHFEAGCDAEGVPHVGVHDLIRQLSSSPGATLSDWMSSEGAGLLGIAVLAVVGEYRAQRSSGS
ncbi:hypothetical protein HET69_33005 [Streptomyces sp. CJ_13]|uniref:hypothetical protein n=1 Tax=Streptomyces sp. CJ_13 TaxID=2724943 RepID=UPI001BDD3693|nr:hypothetical protein [Streptomyces sp. CJ_13]MBT1188674.1 hypothetical protein [Streptomyces sp. CJ_13]